MTFIPALNTAKVAIDVTNGGNHLINTLWFTRGVSWGNADLDDLAAAVVTWWKTRILPNVNANCVLTEVSATDQATQDGHVSRVAVTSGNVGTLSGVALPNNACLVVTFRSDARGRSTRGRNYVPGLTSTVLGSNVNQVTPGHAAALATAYSNLTDVESATPTPSVHCVASHFHNKAARSSALTYEITAYVADVNIDSQRRRLQGRGF